MNRVTEEQKQALYIYFNQLVDDAENKKQLLSIQSDFIDLSERDVFTEVQVKEFINKVVGKYIEFKNRIL